MLITFEEKQIISMYLMEHSRTKTINALRESLPFSDDSNIKKVMEQSLSKLDAMTDEQFVKVDFSTV